MTGLVAPDLTRTWTWLRHAADPASALILWRAGIDADWVAGPQTAQRAVLDDPAVAAALARQLSDGSWGPEDDEVKRIVPTLWALKTLVDLGLDHDVDAIHLALTFLEEQATTDDGYFTTTGTPYGVLACYVGLATRVFHDAGRGDLAAAQLEWLTWYQQVAVAGEHRREAGDWGQGLDRRYGGCFASTSCIVGVTRATEAWSRGADAEHWEAFRVGRETLLERGLAFTRDGTSVLPLSAPGHGVHRWTAPAFPTDWRLTLSDIIYAIAHDDPVTDPRAQRAVDLLMSWRRPDGSWARGWHTTPSFLAGIGASEKGEGNPIVTAHAAVAIARLTT